MINRIYEDLRIKSNDKFTNLIEGEKVYNVET